MAPCEGVVDNSTMETLTEFSSSNDKKQYPSMQSRRDCQEYHESFAPSDDNQGTQQQQQHDLQFSRKRPLYGQQESQGRFNKLGQSFFKQPRQDFTLDGGRGNDVEQKEDDCGKQGRVKPFQQQKSHMERRLERKERSLETPFLHQGPPRHMKHFRGTPQQNNPRWNDSSLQNRGRGLVHQRKSIRERESLGHGSSRMMRPPWSGERRPSGRGAPNGPWENNRRNNTDSRNRRPSNSSASHQRNISRRDTHMPRRQSVSQSESSDSSFSSGEIGAFVKKRVQPGPGAAQRKSNFDGTPHSFAASFDSLDKSVISLPSPKSGHSNNMDSRPPPPPLGSPVVNQQERSLSSVSSGPPEHKRPRTSGQLLSSLGQRWEPSKLHDGTNTQSLSTESNRESFAGRFVPKGGTAESFDKIRAETEHEKDASMALLNSNNHTNTPGVGECCDSATEEQCLEENNVGDRAFGKVATNVATTKVTTETDLKMSASYSTCSLPHANTIPSAEITESPFSLLLPEDEICACEEKNSAATSHIDVPVLEELSQRSTCDNVGSGNGNIENDKPKEIVVTETVAEIKAGSGIDVMKASPRAIPVKAENTVATALPLLPPPLDMTQSDSDSSDDETDEEELQAWAKKMFNIPPPIMVPVPGNTEACHGPSSDQESDEEMEHRQEQSSPRLRLHLKMPPGKHSKKPRRRKKAVFSTRKKGKATGRRKEEEEMLDSEEAKRKKVEAKPLTAAEIRKLLAEDDMGCAASSSHWVRRSMRQPSRSVLHNPGVKSLVEKLRVNDHDMVVLKMKKYISDSSTPCAVIDVALDALEDNTNCQALYIQNFNEGMRDKQVLHLLRILQMPANKIWCLNIGETYNVKTKTWKLFAEGLRKTKVTHMYASEHTISNELKEKIRDTIRKNRKKHDMHCNPSNLDVIMQCTHCWWNPFNAKSLRPFIRQQEKYEKILADAEAQGLPGSNSLPGGDARGASVTERSNSKFSIR